MSTAPVEPTTPADGANPQLDEFKARVRTEALRVCDEQGWDSGDLNDVLAELGLDPVKELTAVDIVVELSAPAGDRDSQEVFADEDAARDAVTSLLSYAHTYNHVPGRWEVRDVRTVTRRTAVSDTTTDGRVVLDDTAPSTTTIVMAAGKARINPIRVAGDESLNEHERESVDVALQPLFRRVRDARLDGPAMEPKLVEITALHYAD
jgi:hypothetical protein